ncbi:MAG: hypothetical protein L0196_06205 [candidate division Zixibacteria bacterium]|nr:hypothetical protein [candidate division Zixibacteria bacterium]
MRTRHVIIICITVLIFAWFIWPTPYSYDKITRGKRSEIVRVNRFTGKQSYPGWSETPKRSTKSEVILPSNEVAKVEIAAGRFSDYCFVDVYNGSEWTIVELTLENKDRKFKVRHSGIQPLSSVEISFYVGKFYDFGDPWKVFETKGFKDN